MHNILVSIIIPVYNREKYIQDTINSVLSSSYKNIEIICVDDGSTDKSFEIIKNLALTDDRIIIFSQTNQGVSVARNTGLNISKGKYVMFVDSDDFISPTAISKCCEYLEQFNADIICFNMLALTKNCREHLCFNDNYFDSYLVNCEAKNYNKAINFTNAAPCIIRKKFLDANNIKFIPNHIYEDWVFMVEVFTNNPYCVFLNEPFYFYNRTVDISLTSNLSEKCIDLFDSYKISKAIINKDLNHVWNKLNDNKILNECLQFFFNRILRSKNEKIFKLYIENLKSLVDSFNPVYLRSVLYKENDDMQNAIEYILSNKIIKKNRLKAHLHKGKAIKSFFNFVSETLSFWFYLLKTEV